MSKKQKLTERQEQIYNLVKHGFTTGYIAERLEISKNTIPKHLTEIYRKKGVSGRDELIEKYLNESESIR